MRYRYKHIYIIFAFTLLFLGNCFHTNKDQTNKIQKKCWDDINFNQIEKIFTHSNIKKEYSFNEFLPKLKASRRSDYKIFFFEGQSEKEDDDLIAIVKPLNSKIRFPIFSYNFSRYMGFNFIPPTVKKIINKKLVSIQLFIKNSKTLYSFTKTSGRGYDFISPIEKSNIYIQAFVSGVHVQHHRDVIVDSLCHKIAVIDNSYSQINHIRYGDFPFVGYEMKNKKYDSLTSLKDYQDFPFDKVKSLKTSTDHKTLATKIPILQEEFKRDLIGWILPQAVDDKIYYIEWKGRVWVKDNNFSTAYLYKKFIPTVFSRRTLRRLKTLNKNTLKRLSGNLLNEELISGILHRRNLILQEAMKRKELILED